MEFNQFGGNAVVTLRDMINFTSMNYIYQNIIHVQAKG